MKRVQACGKKFMISLVSSEEPFQTKYDGLGKKRKNRPAWGRDAEDESESEG